MGYFQVRYNSRVINYDRRGFIRLTTDSYVVRIIMLDSYVNILLNVRANNF